jgi:hypothetical protein
MAVGCDQVSLFLLRYFGFASQHQARHLKNPWGNSKHCLSQFSSPGSGTSTNASPINDAATSAGRGTKGSLKEFKQRLSQARDYDAFADNTIRGEDVFMEVQRVLEQRSIPQRDDPVLETQSTTPSAPLLIRERESHHFAALDASGVGRPPETGAGPMVARAVGPDVGAAVITV